MGKIWQTVKSDFQAVKDRDPAIPDGLRGFFEVILCTPGFQAILAHRLIHFLHTRLRIPILPRFLGLIVRWWTGIEIHPGAQIGKGVFIDHGMGVVIGETAIVKDNVTLFHGVTLGGTGKEKGKHHPTVEEGAFIGAGDKILGNITVVKNSKSGAGSVVVKDVPPDSTVVGIPAFMAKHKGFKLREATANAQLTNTILRRIEELEQELKLLKEELRNVQDQLSIQNKQEVA